MAGARSLVTVQDRRLPKRVTVLGTVSGAGKTTFGRSLAARLAVPFVELDALNWGPNWVALDLHDFRAAVERALASERWVVDGNYGRLGTLVWDRADTVVWLDIPLHVCLARLFRRTLHRIRTREELWSGNRETFRQAFFSRDSLFLWALRRYRLRRRRYEEFLTGPVWSRHRVYRFGSNADADHWLATLPSDTASL